MKVFKRILNIFLDIIILLIFIISICIIFINKKQSENKVPSLFNIVPSVVLTNSMSPTINPGDLIITKKINSTELKVGDVVTFYGKVNNERALITHRIVKIEEDTVTTRGDNHEVSIDNDTPMSVDNVLSVYSFRIPKVGYLINFIKTPLGFILLVIIPLIIYIIFLALKLFKAYLKKNEYKAIIEDPSEEIRNKIIDEYLKSMKRDEKL